MRIWDIYHPVAQANQGTVVALDIEKEMVVATQKKADQAGLVNISIVQRDFLTVGTGLPETSYEYVMLFNILHAEEPLKILADAHRILVLGGRVGVIHWIHDGTTPPGPSLNIHPTPKQCQSWLIEAGFNIVG